MAQLMRGFGGGQREKRPTFQKENTCLQHFIITQSCTERAPLRGQGFAILGKRCGTFKMFTVVSQPFSNVFSNVISVTGYIIYLLFSLKPAQAHIKKVKKTINISSFISFYPFVTNSCVNTFFFCFLVTVPPI